VTKSKKYLSVAEYGKLLGISRIAVYKQIKKGQLKAITIGGRLVIPSAALGEILGGPLSERRKEIIAAAVRKTFADYGDVLKRLGNE
jgi:excisionase family DNA binding protein